MKKDKKPKTEKRKAEDTEDSDTSTKQDTFLSGLEDEPRAKKHKREQEEIAGKDRAKAAEEGAFDKYRITGETIKKLKGRWYLTNFFFFFNECMWAILQGHLTQFMYHSRTLKKWSSQIWWNI